jgi:hypothetical protein
MKKIAIILLITFLAIGACAAPKKVVKKMNPQNISIISPSFKNMEYLPAKFSGNGKGINPSLIFENIPLNAKCLVLIMDDPDAPYATFVHWLMFNIPPKTKEIKENSIPQGAVMGMTSSGILKYVPPSPPPGKPHRYVFKLYALDRMLSLKEGASKDSIEIAMQGHIIAHTSLTGLYKR